PYRPILTLPYKLDGSRLAHDGVRSQTGGAGGESRNSSVPMEHISWVAIMIGGRMHYSSATDEVSFKSSLGLALTARRLTFALEEFGLYCKLWTRPVGRRCRTRVELPCCLSNWSTATNTIFPSARMFSRPRNTGSFDSDLYTPGLPN